MLWPHLVFANLASPQMAAVPSAPAAYLGVTKIFLGLNHAICAHWELILFLRGQEYLLVVGALRIQSPCPKDSRRAMDAYVRLVSQAGMEALVRRVR